MEKGNVFIRKAVREDAELVLDFIKGIARYEKMEDEVEATVEMIEEQLFDKGRAEVIFAVENGREVGFALFFHNFSTFVGRSGLYLEDLFVLPEYRGRGYGKALFLELVRIARERNCGRMEWVCLDWNKPSIDFYRSMGAVPLDEWTTYRLAGDALARLAE
ncbi:MAG: GNAT family N-acetyltransferase [Bacteroidaceae bacterium]|nr:GNAT family N-acetyltransferase [Bacteroidaceae bacterium]